MCVSWFLCVCFGVQSILEALNIPVAMLPQIRSSSEVYTNATEGGLDGQSMGDYPATGRVFLSRV